MMNKIVTDSPESAPKTGGVAPPAVPLTTPHVGISVSGLVRSYGKNIAADDVSFEVPPGSFCTLLGSSGSGKSTVLRMLAGLDRPQQGEIRIGDRVVNSDRAFVPPERRGVGFVFQAYALWPHMTAFDQIAYPLRVRKVPSARIKESVRAVAQTVGLSQLMHRYPSELSGGQQQRVALARALVIEPSVLLLDEPLSNLDTSLRLQMRFELEQLHRRINVTTIYVTHDQEEAMALSDMVVVMSEGRVVEIGSPRQVYEAPRVLHTAAFIGSSIILNGVVGEVSKEKVTFVLPDGSKVLGSARDRLEAGDPAALVVKPVDLEVVRAGAAAGNVLQGQVVAATYLGAAVELRILIGDVHVHVRVQRRSDFAAGDRVAVPVAPELVSILPREASA